MSDYLQALSKTDREHTSYMEKGSTEETNAIRQFTDLFGRFEAERLKGGVVRLYAKDAYFRDSFAELNSAEEIEAYFVRSALSVDECIYEMQDVAEHDGNYYFRWTMSLRLERYKDQPADVSVGMTHVRFNKDGRVIFHQDYWDAANVYEKHPLSDGMIRFAKKWIEE